MSFYAFDLTQEALDEESTGEKSLYHTMRDECDADDEEAALDFKVKDPYTTPVKTPQRHSLRSQSSSKRRRSSVAQAKTLSLQRNTMRSRNVSARENLLIMPEI